MNRRNFLSSIIVAPAIIDSKGLFRGSADVWTPDSGLAIPSGLDVVYYYTGNGRDWVEVTYDQWMSHGPIFKND